MRTYLECIPCFFKQSLETSRILGIKEELQKKILDEIGRHLSDFSLTASPPEMGKIIHNVIKKYTGTSDPFKEVKKRSNEMVLGVYNNLKEKIESSSDSLLTAVEFSIAGNIIDFGVRRDINIEKEINKILEFEKQSMKRGIFDYECFKKSLEESASVLFIGDNAGEIVLDKILIEEIKRRWKEKEIIYAVRDVPIINDATLEDAFQCGMDKVCKVISSGSDAPGTILSLCSKQFLNIFKNADMVISKGQGNFESLSDEKRPIFFLLMVKCDIVARDIGVKKGDIVLFYNRKK